MTFVVRLQTIAAFCAMLLFAMPAHSEMQNAEAALLTISGQSGEAGSAFSRADLNALPQHTVRTSTAWTDGPQTFQGPLVRDVLSVSNTRGETARAIALNDYSVEIPVADFDRYDVILALRHNGEAMSVRDKGPIWIVYPRDSHAELQTAKHNAKWIWQLARIDVR